MIKKCKGKQLLLMVFIIPFVVLPVYFQFVVGTFRWHITNSALWRDAAELAMYIVVMLLLGILSSKMRFYTMMILGIIYFLSFGTLGSIIVSYLYIELLLFVGRTIGKSFLKKDYESGVEFVLGTCVWGTGALLLSFINLGTIGCLRVYSFVLLIFCLVLMRDNLNERKFLIVKFSNFLSILSKREYVVVTLFYSIMMVAFARINTFLESDSCWYALNVDKCLFGNNSFLDNLGYTSFVYYYPKFKELLFAPISGLKIPGYLIAANLWILVIICKEIYLFIERKTDRIVAILVTELICSTVSIIGIAGTAKSDILSYFYMFMAFVCFEYYLAKHKKCYLYIAITSAILSYTTKLTAYLFMSLMGINFIVCLLRKRGKLESYREKKEKEIIFVFVASFILFGILYRTFILTGFPLYPIGAEFFEKIGFRGKQLFGTTIDFVPVFEPQRIISVLFKLDDSGKIMAQWMGNYLCYFVILWILCGGIKRKVFKDYKVYCFITLNTAFIYFLTTQSVPDGNYFSIIIIISMLIIIPSIYENIHVINNKYILVAVMLCFLSLNMLMNFVCHPSWGTGTRFSFDSINLLVSECEIQDNVNKNLQNSGLGLIEVALKDDADDRIVIAEIDTPLLTNFLDARIELVSETFSTHMNSNPPTTYEEFQRFIRIKGVGGLIVKNDVNDKHLFKQFSQQYIEENGYENQVVDSLYTYYKLKECEYSNTEKLMKGEYLPIKGIYEDGWKKQRECW